MDIQRFYMVFLTIFIEAQLIYIMLVSMYNKVIQLYIYPYISFFRFFSIIDYYKILSIYSYLCYTVAPCCFINFYI